MNRGMLLALVPALLAGCANRNGENEVSIGDLPTAVRATLDRETRGGRVTEVDKETGSGRVVYSADAMVDGQEWEIDIAEDGTLLSKAPETDVEGDREDDDDDGL